LFRTGGLLFRSGGAAYGSGVTALPVHYRSDDEDSARWMGFPFRAGDIVISTRSKSGTTWMQMICALLVFGSPELPAPLSDLSPWLDWLVAPRHEVVKRLEAQTHRRFIKTHTPLDGLPLDRRATYIVVARQPLDMAVSLYHHGDNLDRDLMRNLIDRGVEGSASPFEARPELPEWLRSWIEWDGPPAERLDSLVGVMWHLSDAWSRRNDGNVLLVHYDDLANDLDGEMRRLALRLDLAISEDNWSEVVAAATFEAMRDRADHLAPGPDGVLKSRKAFFRRGSSGAGARILSGEVAATYEARLRDLAPSDLLAWLDRRPPV